MGQWDVTTATYTGKSVSVSSHGTGYYTGVNFKTDGTKMYITRQAFFDGGGTIYPYTLSTAWDISTATYDGAGKSVSAQDSAPDGIDMNGDGTSLYIVGDSNDAVYQYEIIGGFTPKMIFYS